MFSKKTCIHKLVNTSSCIFHRIEARTQSYKLRWILLLQNFWPEISLQNFWRSKIQRKSTLKFFYRIGSRAGSFLFRYQKSLFQFELLKVGKVILNWTASSPAWTFKREEVASCLSSNNFFFFSIQADSFLTVHIFQNVLRSIITSVYSSCHHALRSKLL